LFRPLNQKLNETNYSGECSALKFFAAKTDKFSGVLNPNESVV